MGHRLVDRRSAGCSFSRPQTNVLTSCKNLLGKVLGVLSGTDQRGRLVLVQKAEPKEVQARLAGHTPAMNGLARMVEDRLVHPAEVVSEAGGPNDGPNPGGPEVRAW